MPFALRGSAALAATAMTVLEALRSSARKLAQTSDAPQLDAQFLLLHALHKKETSWLFAYSEQELTREQRSTYARCVAQRAAGKPLAYILGYWEFYGRRFEINSHVLVPRPSTEQLIDLSLILIKQLRQKKRHPLVVADIGTGSGCIAITLLLESPHIQTMYATDISAPALALSKRNAAFYHIIKKMVFVKGNMLEPLRGNKIDLIVSNPPYLPTKELLAAGSIRLTAGLTFEPRVALDGGTDGKRYCKHIKESRLPAVIETTGGDIQLVNVRH